MALHADSFLDRIKLKQQITRWRTSAIIIFFMAIALYISSSEISSKVPSIGKDHIARVSIEGIISDEPLRTELFESLAKNESVKAVLLRADSPGGTAVGGEELYRDIRALSEKKPVVVLMRTMCTSACYMAAIAGDHVLAREGSITGSIGVIIQGAEFTGLVEKIGVTPITIKSGRNKATPSPFEKLEDDQRAVVQDVVNDFYGFFTRLVKERRKIGDDVLPTLADGRIFTGTQALERKLIDAIGGEKEALQWLEKNRQIKADMDVRDVRPKRHKEGLFGDVNQMIRETFLSKSMVGLDGLLLIWQPPLN